MSEVHIHRPESFTWRTERVCRRCKATTDHVVQSYVWYGPIVVCCQCGAHRNDGVLRRRRKSDAAVAEHARRTWETAGDLEAFRAWLDAQVTAYIEVGTA